MSTQTVSKLTLNPSDVVAANIRMLTALLGWNQLDLAAALDMKQSTVNQKWNGRRKWTLDELGDVARVLRVTVADLVTPPPGYEEYVAAELENPRSGGSHQYGDLARSKGLEPPTF